MRRVRLPHRDRVGEGRWFRPAPFTVFPPRYREATGRGHAQSRGARPVPARTGHIGLQASGYSGRTPLLTPDTRVAISVSDILVV